VQPEGLGKLKKFILYFGYRTGDLPACSIAPTLLRAPMSDGRFINQPILSSFASVNALNKMNRRI
jgi:hypothetical protein